MTARRPGRGQTIPFFLVLLALLATGSASAARAAAAPDPLGDVSRHAAFTEESRHASAVEMPGRRAALLGALGIGADGELRLRSGGSGVLTISLARQIETAVPVGGLRLRIAVPRQYAAGSVRASGWSCARHGAVVGCRAPGVDAAGALAPIELGLRARGSGRAAIPITATWRQHGRRYSTSDVARFRVRPPLRLRASSAATVLSPAPGLPASPIVLSARLGGSSRGLPVQYRWRRLGAHGRGVHWLTATGGRASGRTVTAQVGVPRVERPTHLRFAVTARSWRGTATATTTVTVLPQSAVRLHSPHKLHVIRKPRASRAKAATFSQHLGVDGPKTQARLEFSAHQHGARAEYARRGKGTVVARASSVAGGGDVSFCSLWSAVEGGSDGDPITLEDGSEFALGGATADGDGCGDEGAAIDFDDGTLVVSGVKFADVVGSLDAEGLRLRSADLLRPAGMVGTAPGSASRRPRLLRRLGRESHRRRVGAAAGADRTRQRPRTVAAARRLELPARRSRRSNIVPLKGSFELQGLARAPEGSGGEVTFEGALDADGTTTAKVEATDLAVLEGDDGEPVGLSGEGEITATPGKGGGTVTGSVALATDAGKAIPLFSGVEIENGVGSWDEEGIELGGDVRVETKNGAFEAAVAGSFASRSEWKLEVTQSEALPLTEGITLAGVHGLLERAPAAEAESDGAEEGAATAGRLDEAQTAAEDESSATDDAGSTAPLDRPLRLGPRLEPVTAALGRQRHRPHHQRLCRRRQGLRPRRGPPGDGSRRQRPPARPDDPLGRAGVGQPEDARAAVLRRRPAGGIRPVGADPDQRRAAPQQRRSAVVHRARRDRVERDSLGRRDRGRTRDCERVQRDPTRTQRQRPRRRTIRRPGTLVLGLRRGEHPRSAVPRPGRVDRLGLLPRGHLRHLRPRGPLLRWPAVDRQRTPPLRDPRRAGVARRPDRRRQGQPAEGDRRTEPADRAAADRRCRTCSVAATNSR